MCGKVETSVPPKTEDKLWLVEIPGRAAMKVHAIDERAAVQTVLGDPTPGNPGYTEGVYFAAITALLGASKVTEITPPKMIEVPLETLKLALRDGLMAGTWWRNRPELPYEKYLEEMNARNELRRLASS